MGPEMNEVERARRWVREAERIVVLTGAGISAESGVPTFRGDGGLWRTYRAEELATPGAFARDPRLVWEWYGWRRERVAACEPNAAHLALARLALDRDGVRIVTQNVDGLHTAAARAAAGERDPEPALPIELHGSIFRVRCTACGTRREDRGPIAADREDSLPRCGRCGSLLRPDVVWFGEALDPALLDEAARAAADADLCLVVGTSGIVHPAAGLPALTRAGGGRIVEVNPHPTPISDAAELCIRAPAAVAVPGITG